jgi:transcriptional regulator with XRE-family HTH domain
VEAGLRQVDVANALGKPQAFVSFYESGVRRLDLLELRQICGVLGISLIDLVRRFEKSLR